MKNVLKLISVSMLSLIFALTISSSNISASERVIPKAGGSVSCSVGSPVYLGSSVGCDKTYGSSFYYGMIPYGGYSSINEIFWYSGMVPYVGELY